MSGMSEDDGNDEDDGVAEEDDGNEDIVLADAAPRQSTEQSTVCVYGACVSMVNVGGGG